MRLARRVQGAGESATFVVQQATAALRARGIEVIDLGIGEPDFPMPKAIRDGAIQAIEEGFTRYTPTPGIPKLREAIARRYQERHGLPGDRANVAVTVGAKQALANVFLSCLDPGDEAIVMAPCWVSIPDQIRLAGGKAVFVSSSWRKGFLPDPAEVERAIGPCSRLLVLNSPCNPTGAVYPRDILGALIEIARAHNLIVVSDETYEQFAYETAGHVSAASFHRELGERLVIIGSFSKTYAMTGLRVGYVLADPELIGAVTALQGQTTSNTSSISQRAALAALAGADVGEATVDEYRLRRDLVVESLTGIPGVELVPPAGAFYAFPWVEGALMRLGIANSGELATRLLNEEHVAVVPGAPFEGEGFIRISFAVERAILTEGLRRVRRLLSSSPLVGSPGQ